MRNYSVIDIEHPGVSYERLSGSESIYKKNKLIAYFLVSPSELPKRVLLSFVPPVFGKNSKKVHVDFVGPLIALILLACVLHYGHANKDPKALVPTSPTVALLCYVTILPITCLFAAKIGDANLSTHTILALLGYGLYGHLFTVAASLLFDGEVTNTFFFLLMCLFGVASSLKIVIVFIFTIPKPICRLLICSFVSNFNLLFLILIYFTYMHRTFKYGVNS